MPAPVLTWAVHGSCVVGLLKQVLQAGGLKPAVYSLTALEAESLKSRCQQARGSL